MSTSYPAPPVSDFPLQFPAQDSPSAKDPTISKGYAKRESPKEPTKSLPPHKDNNSRPLDKNKPSDVPASPSDKKKTKTLTKEKKTPKRRIKKSRKKGTERNRKTLESKRGCTRKTVNGDGKYKGPVPTIEISEGEAPNRVAIEPTTEASPRKRRLLKLRKGKEKKEKQEKNSKGKKKKDEKGKRKDKRKDSGKETKKKKKVRKGTKADGNVKVKKRKEEEGKGTDVGNDKDMKREEKPNPVELKEEKEMQKEIPLRQAEKQRALAKEKAKEKGEEEEREKDKKQDEKGKEKIIAEDVPEGKNPNEADPDWKLGSWIVEMTARIDTSEQYGSDIKEPPSSWSKNAKDIGASFLLRKYFESSSWIEEDKKEEHRSTIKKNSPRKPDSAQDSVIKPSTSRSPFKRLRRQQKEKHLKDSEGKKTPRKKQSKKGKAKKNDEGETPNKKKKIPKQGEDIQAGSADRREHVRDNKEELSSKDGSYQQEITKGTPMKKKTPKKKTPKKKKTSKSKKTSRVEEGASKGSSTPKKSGGKQEALASPSRSKDKGKGSVAPPKALKGAKDGAEVSTEELSPAEGSADNSKRKKELRFQTQNEPAQEKRPADTSLQRRKVAHKTALEDAYFFMELQGISPPRIESDYEDSHSGAADHSRDTRSDTSEAEDSHSLYDASRGAEIPAGAVPPYLSRSTPQSPTPGGGKREGSLLGFLVKVVTPRGEKKAADKHPSQSALRKSSKGDNKKGKKEDSSATPPSSRGSSMGSFATFISPKRRGSKHSEKSSDGSGKRKSPGSTVEHRKSSLLHWVPALGASKDKKTMLLTLDEDVSSTSSHSSHSTTSTASRNQLNRPVPPEDEEDSDESLSMNPHHPHHGLSTSLGSIPRDNNDASRPMSPDTQSRTRATSMFTPEKEQDALEDISEIVHLSTVDSSSPSFTPRMASFDSAVAEYPLSLQLSSLLASREQILRTFLPPLPSLLF